MKKIYAFAVAFACLALAACTPDMKSLSSFDLNDVNFNDDESKMHLSYTSALSALSYSCFLIIVNRSQRIKHISEHALTFYALVVGATLFLGYQIIDGTPILQGIDQPSEVLNLIGLAIFPTMISMLTISISTRLIGPTKTAVLGVFEPLTGILVGTLMFAEPMTPNILIGIAICIAAVLFMVVSERKA